MMTALLHRTFACVLVGVVVASGGWAQATVMTFEVVPTADDPYSGTTRLGDNQWFAWSWIVTGPYNWPPTVREDMPGYGHRVDGGAATTASVAGSYWPGNPGGSSGPARDCTLHYRHDGEGWTPNIDANIDSNPNPYDRYWGDGYQNLTDVLINTTGRVENSTDPNIASADFVFVVDEGYKAVLHDFKAGVWGTGDSADIFYRIDAVTLNQRYEVTEVGDELLGTTFAGTVTGATSGLTMSLGDFEAEGMFRLQVIVDTTSYPTGDGSVCLDDLRFSQIPEPSLFVLLASAVGLALVWRRSR